MVFKRTQSNKRLQEAALVFIAIRKSHEGIDLGGKKQCLLFSRATTTITSIPYATNNLFRKYLQQIFRQYLQPNQL